MLKQKNNEDPEFSSKLSEKRQLHGREVSSPSGPREEVFCTVFVSESGGSAFYCLLSTEGHRNSNSQKTLLEQNIPNTFYLHSTYAFSSLESVICHMPPL